MKAPWEKREMMVVQRLASERSLRRWGQVDSPVSPSGGRNQESSKSGSPLGVC